MRIGIFGIGCIGSILAKYLSVDSSNEYYYFNRGEREELKIHYKDQLTRIPIQLTDKMNGELDWLLICLKQYHLAETKSSIKELIHPNTKLAIFQNGIDLSDNFLDLSKRSNILETIIDCPTQKNEKGEFIQLRGPKIILPNTLLAKEFINLAKNTALDIKLSDQFRREQWEKLIESSSMGSLQVILQAPCSIFKENHILEEYVELLKEGVRVAKSDGITLGENFIAEKLAKLQQYPDNKGSSMLTDKLAGRPIELEAKIGAIVKIGLKNGVGIPVSQRIYELLLADA